MKSFIFCFVLSTFFASSLQADPEESQLLRGLGGRSFAVEVTELGTINLFPNCYSFNEDGSWIDPLFPVPGTWTQDSPGAATTYTATGVLPIGGGIAVLLTQVGRVTPARGKGTLQLDADTSADIVTLPDLVFVENLANFRSVGAQDNQCSE